METIIWIGANYGAEWLMLDIRADIYQRLSDIPNLSPSDVMPEERIREYVLFSSRLNVLLYMSSMTVVLVGFLLVLRYWVFSPIETILEKDRIEEEQRPELVPEQEIPANEIGTIMRSRNKLLSTMDQIFSEEAIETLVQAVEEKDPYTQGHSRRVGNFGALIGDIHGLDNSKCEKLRYSGTLHDLGKIGISDQILTKPDDLTDEEYEEIKSHPERGANIIQFGIFDDDILHGIMHHHESYDGSGYPEGLEGENIPLFGRILAVADAVDAMLSDRHYRDGLSIDIVRDELEDNKNSQFDPEFAEIGLNLLTVDYTDQLPDLFEEAVANS